MIGNEKLHYIGTFSALTHRLIATILCGTWDMNILHHFSFYAIAIIVIDTIAVLYIICGDIVFKNVVRPVYSWVFAHTAHQLVLNSASRYLPIYHCLPLLPCACKNCREKVVHSDKLKDSEIAILISTSHYLPYHLMQNIDFTLLHTSPPIPKIPIFSHSRPIIRDKFLVPVYLSPFTYANANNFFLFIIHLFYYSKVTKNQLHLSAVQLSIRI